MNRTILYVFKIFILLILLRFSGRIIPYFIRFWYITIPLILVLTIHFSRKNKQRKFQERTHLDPDKEVKLKKEPKIKDEEE